MVENSRGDFLEYKLYLTRGWSIHDIVHIAENHTQSNDLFTGLQQKTKYTLNLGCAVNCSFVIKIIIFLKLWSAQF
jgi:hypothetical protein